MEAGAGGGGRRSGRATKATELGFGWLQQRGPQRQGRPSRRGRVARTEPDPPYGRHRRVGVGRWWLRPLPSARLGQRGRAGGSGREREGATKREEERGRSREGGSEAAVYIWWVGSEVKAGQQQWEARKREEAGPESAPGKIRFKQRWPSDGRSDGRGNCGRRGHPERWPKQAGIMIVNMEKKFSLGVVTPSSKPRT